jgi:cbb3-type cytochrome oxidase maturation protein
MEVLVFLVPLALMLGFIGLVGFLWSLRNGQYDDLEGAGWRAIADDEPVQKPLPERHYGPWVQMLRPTETITHPPSGLNQTSCKHTGPFDLLVLCRK